MRDWRPTHRHYKGGEYRVICEAKHTERQGMLIIYEDEFGNIWARPSLLFNYPGRFVPVDETKG